MNVKGYTRTAAFLEASSASKLVKLLSLIHNTTNSETLSTYSGFSKEQVKALLGNFDLVKPSSAKTTVEKLTWDNFEVPWC